MCFNGLGVNMRNIFKIIDKIIACVPESEIEIKKGLNKIQRDAFYKAPEIISDCWWELAYYLQKMLGDIDIDWKLKISDIMRDKEE